MDQVNIIMAAYNGEKFIGEQIDSILKNDYENLVLWIFDDGSTDGTSIIINKFTEQYPDKIKYYKNKDNLGVTKNFLQGLNYAAQNCIHLNNQEQILNTVQMQTEHYFMFCDQDDVWLPEKIKKTLKHMKKVEKKHGKDSAAAVFTDAIIVDENLQELFPSFYQRSKLDIKKLDLPHLMMENKLIGCTVMINSALQKKLSVIPERARYHDWWVGLAASAFGHISFLPEPTLNYRQHSKNVVGNQSFSSYVQGRLKALPKQKEVLFQTMKQAEEFYDIYKNDLKNTQKMQVYAMSKLTNNNWLKRRILLFRYGFLKTGIVRNIGLLCVI